MSETSARADRSADGTPGRPLGEEQVGASGAVIGRAQGALPLGTAALPLRALDTSADKPWPVRHLSPKIADYVAKMPPVWVEGQVLNLKRWNTMYFLTLRDTDLDMSVSVTLPASALRVVGGETAVRDGTHLVVRARPSFHVKNGTLSLAGDQARMVGVGELLVRIEHLRAVLASEGLFDVGRKKPLPFLPHVVGLVCAQQGDAEHDVVSNARARWPEVTFEIRRVTVQGPQAVPAVTTALAELDADPRVEVIVVARGGGSFEDLLPFSNETLLRAVAACRTPVVSAIGHEKDAPLLDLVADHRASTPTAAARRIVPDVSEERTGVLQARQRIRASVDRLVRREAERLEAMRSRPVLARPSTLVDGHEREVAQLRRAATAVVDRALHLGHAEVGRLAAQVTALSPAATLERGYAVVQRAEDGAVVRSPADADAGTVLRLRLAEGEIAAVAGTEPEAVGGDGPTSASARTVGARSTARTGTRKGRGTAG
ncbi:MAG: exodeoxyribonuclease large subunit [Actinotalea sp.]|nr:exodeoxyribonuclease large subunit [Actinotalea sp.]